MAIYRFDSIEEFAHTADSTVHNKYRDETFRQDWYGGETWDDARTLALTGDESLVPEAEALLDKIDSNVEVCIRKRVNSPYGSFVNVPDYLSGSPTPMRRRIKQPSDTSPVNIYVSTTCSWDIDAETMLKRGVAILALLLKLQQVRPIQLYLLSETDGTGDGYCIQVIRVESQPLAVGSACHALAHVGFARRLCYGMAKHLQEFEGSWPSNYHDRCYRKWLRSTLNMGPLDLYIPAATSWDEMITDPVLWVNREVSRFTSDLEPEEPAE